MITWPKLSTYWGRGKIAPIVCIQQDSVILEQWKFLWNMSQLFFCYSIIKFIDIEMRMVDIFNQTLVNLSLPDEICSTH